MSADGSPIHPAGWTGLGPNGTSREIDGVWAEAGDVFFAHGSGLLPRLIRWAESDPGETNGVWANHMGVVVESGWIVPPGADAAAQGELSRRLAFRLATTVEALWRVERAFWWSRHRAEYQGGYRVRVFRRRTWPTERELRLFRTRAAGFVGDKYGWWKLLFQLGDRLVFRGHKVLSSMLFVDKRPICSYLAGEVCYSAGWTFGVPPEALDPDTGMRYCLTSGEWVEVTKPEDYAVPAAA